LDKHGLSSTDGDKIGKVIRAAQKEAARREHPVAQALRDARAPELAEIPPLALEDIKKSVREDLVRLSGAAKANPDLGRITIGALLTDVFSLQEALMMPSRARLSSVSPCTFSIEVPSTASTLKSRSAARDARRGPHMGQSSQ
jgi:hypothetical protein